MQGGLAGSLAQICSRPVIGGTRPVDRPLSPNIRVQESAFAPEQDVPIVVNLPSFHRQQPWLPAALAELRECSAEAREENYPEPTATSLAAAETVLRRIARLSGGLPEPSVYPTADHEVAIFFCRNDVDAGVLITIDADGGGACFSNARGHRRARYGDIGDLPDAFVKGELERLRSLSRAI